MMKIQRAKDKGKIQRQHDVTMNLFKHLLKP